MVSCVSVVEPLPGCLGLNPQAERAKDARSAPKPSALKGALLSQPDSFSLATIGIATTLKRETIGSSLTR